MEELINGITCPKFVGEETVLKELTSEINNTKDLAGKAECAEKIMNEVEPLLSCEEYDERKTDCKNCHIISSLRIQAVDIIMKMHQSVSLEN
ncbi:MAG TPA: hypothetical protein ACFYD6_11145 [Candidatus Brocadiia bacterium]|nr:hypothetical protein [Planctomycetota bacterium]MDO8092979.1 hypothetical protein [Candidatus Brocadiales bacterium]